MMKYEVELEAEFTGEEFKMNALLQNPRLYHELFEKEQFSPLDEELDFPESEAEFQAMVASMKRQGLTS